MITLAFLLDHQVISRSDKNTVVAGSKNYVRARFILRTDDWARPITAIFGGYTQLLDDNNECTVPWEVLQQPGKVEVSAFCGAGVFLSTQGKQKPDEFQLLFVSSIFLITYVAARSLMLPVGFLPSCFT